MKDNNIIPISLLDIIPKINGVVGDFIINDDNGLLVVDKNNMEFTPSYGVPPQDKAAALAQVEQWLRDIEKQEAECIAAIHLRYCLTKGLRVDDAHVTVQYPFELNNNVYQYWYKFSTPEAYMLMTRELRIVDFKPVLNIQFNAELAREGE